MSISYQIEDNNNYLRIIDGHWGTSTCLEIHHSPEEGYYFVDDFTLKEEEMYSWEALSKTKEDALRELNRG